MPLTDEQRMKIKAKGEALRAKSEALKAAREAEAAAREAEEAAAWEAQEAEDAQSSQSWHSWGPRHEVQQTADPNCVRSMDHILTKLNPDFNTTDTEDVDVWSMLATLYQSAPDRFQVMGSVHNDVRGAETYYSIRINMAKCYWTMHIFGIWRFYKMRATRATIKTPKNVFAIQFRQ